MISFTFHVMMDSVNNDVLVSLSSFLLFSLLYFSFLQEISVETNFLMYSRTLLTLTT